MIQICDQSKCTGCSACANKCPKDAISMNPDQGLGHLFPNIDSDSCIDCGVCQKVCPALHPQPLRRPLAAYAGWHKNEYDYVASTSGGAATALGKAIILEGGVVYGCTILPGIEVQHIRIEKVDDLERLRGSKYVQSAIGETYRQIKNDLEKGRKVLFVGTPCQVAGIKSIVGKKNDFLYTVDLICHGVPSNAFLKSEILRYTKGLLPDTVVFRKGSYLLLLLLQGKEIYRSSLFEERYKNIYYNTFFDGFTYRDSCHNCSFATPDRVSDLTIGDFWGLDEKNKPLPLEHPHGCSVLLPTTDKGMELIQKIKEEFHLFEREVSEAITGNDQLHHPKRKDWRIRLFLHIYKIAGIANAYRLCMADKILRHKIKNLLKRN